MQKRVLVSVRLYRRIGLKSYKTLPLQPIGEFLIWNSREKRSVRTGNKGPFLRRPSGRLCWTWCATRSFLGYFGRCSSRGITVQYRPCRRLELCSKGQRYEPRRQQWFVYAAHMLEAFARRVIDCRPNRTDRAALGPSVSSSGICCYTVCGWYWTLIYLLPPIF
jgi:hypothetical protein